MAGVLARHPEQEPRGQSLVEFALLLPIFLMLVIGLVEFSMAFNALLSVNFASRDAALLAAEAGEAAGADCIILKSIEDNVGRPADRDRIEQVTVYWSTDTGAVKPGFVNTYQRTGSTTCVLPAGVTMTVPYRLVGTAGYAETDRCAVVAGCGGSHDTVDTIGVSIRYGHHWVTPVANILSFGGSGFTFTHSTAMRMEPIL